jgi:predicted deacylase
MTIRFPAPGRKEQRLLTFDAPLLAGVEWPYFAISGAQDGPTLCLIAGIHGAEYPPIDAVMRFCRALDPQALRGRVVGVPVVNLPAFWERTPFVCPRDGKNPNRVFPGDPSGTFSEVLAHHMFQEVIRQCDYLIDLHCGVRVEDLEPFSLVRMSGSSEVDRSALELAVSFGLPYLVVQPFSGGPIAGTTNAAAAQAGIPAIIAEVGGVGQLQAAAVEMHLLGLRRSLQHLGMLEGEPEPGKIPTTIREFTWVRAERGGFFRKRIVAGDQITAGEVIGEMVNLWGETTAAITTPASGVVLFVTTSPAIADDGLLVGIGVPA